MRGLRWLLVGLLWSCASTSSAPAFSPEALWAEAETGSECADGDEDQCLAPWCVDGTCALFRCEDLEPGRVVRTRSALAPPVFVAPGSGPQRTWGSAQGLPGDAMPVMVFHWYPREQLPSEVKRQKAMEEWAKRPKERHHIFPQAFKNHFDAKLIDIHQYVIAIDADLHRRIHRGAGGGPWNQDWQIFIDDQGQRGSREQHFDYASLMIQKYGLFGLTMTYWQQVDLAPIPVGD
ncbi:TIGR02269 family lipoprotein [Corallococcus exiguus]|uniref:SitA6 family polymorphic toxin lipoprotein n=1 Tax=Corallococcus TaxID=83461 RepID=UPI000ED69390|nr:MULTISPECIES: TIGR02269 family lipoprotein [Corallococcus]NNB86440.1 TIGR02269 family lipoprotein [Corallococcus exiguus]NNC20415.1 TIGR02269 family lipoprotein [Corallococcus exiguus]NRD54384.1 TIGR02269 family lipoprotein [Corallococcus exiguus]RKI05924.1 TIGR02269 family lipoprotein [Corallococcus sp. AB030]